MRPVFRNEKFVRFLSFHVCNVCVNRFERGFYFRTFSGFIQSDGGQIVDYESNRAKYLNKYKKSITSDFKEAVSQMDEYIRDPIVSSSL